MEPISLTTVAATLLTQAKDSHSGRAAQTVYGGHEHGLRQTVIALAGGHELAEHESPGGGDRPGAQRRRPAHRGRRGVAGRCR